MTDGWYKVTNGKEEHILYVHKNHTEKGSLAMLWAKNYTLEPVFVLTKDEMEKVVERQYGRSQ